jgi:CRP-like cAMP-binding protein
MPMSPKSVLNTATPSAPQTPAVQASLDELMLLGQLREYEHRVEHLEHEVYMKNLHIQSCRMSRMKMAKEVLGQRLKIARLKQESAELKQERDQKDQELFQARRVIRMTAQTTADYLATNGLR